MAKINVYLNFNGNTEEAFSFYKSVFGGEFTSIMRWKEVPSSAGRIPEADGNKIMHMALRFDKDNVIAVTDTIESAGPKVVFGSNYTININARNEDEANRIFNALSAGGKITMPLEKAFWGNLFGMFTDKFGVQWMMNYEYPGK